MRMSRRVGHLAVFLLVATGYAAAAGQELPDLACEGDLSIQSVQPDRTKVGCYEKVELTVALSATYENPFDPDEIDVQAEFSGPDGEPVTVPGFIYQPYRLRGEYSDDTAPLLDEAGPPEWHVRFAPTRQGTWRYRVKVQDRSGTARSVEQSIMVMGSGRPGYIRVSDRNPRYFEFDDQTPFIPIGQNLQNDWTVYSHSRRLVQAGCNATRPWTFCHWTWLEWTHRDDIQWAGPGHYMRSYGGAGSYNQRMAWIADLHLSQWERDGLYVMLCLGNAGELYKKGYDHWDGHPYNETNGGFLQSGADFWTDQVARRHARNRLRYIVARYGYSPNVWAWELWNEVGGETDQIVEWHREMAAYLHQIDPANHLVTTSHWGTNAENSPRTWALSGIDFTQTHNYGEMGSIKARTATMLALSPEPHVVGEGGGEHPGPGGAADPEGIGFHNSLWGALFSGAAGPTLPWWWRERIEPNDLWHHYTAISCLAGSIDWTSRDWRPMDANAARVTAPGQGWSPVILEPLGSGWGEASPRNEFTVAPDGQVDGIEALGSLLYGTARADWANPPTLILNPPVDCRMVLRISDAAYGILEVEVDGAAALRDDRFNGPPQTFNVDIEVPLEAGPHRVTLRNLGADRLRVRHIALTRYRNASRFPDIDVLALRCADAAAFWAWHRLNEWTYRSLGIPSQPIPGGIVTLHDLLPGRYAVEWWDPYTGEMRQGSDVVSDGSRVQVQLPEIVTDVACVLRLHNSTGPPNE